MSRNGSVELDFADGTHVFRLAWGQLLLLQEACDAGPYVVLDRLTTNKWMVQDISHVIRLGLIGGGLKPADALRAVRNYVEDRPPLENVLLARMVLAAALIGSPEEGVEKKSEAPDQERSTTSQTEGSDSELSTEQDKS